MTTIAYIANQLPSSLEPYVTDEITELRRHGLRVICCSGKRVSREDLTSAEQDFCDETHYFQPLTDDQILRAIHRLASNRRHLWRLVRPVLREPRVSASRRIRTLGHTVMGSALADQLAPLGVEHIHAHHGYFASWMALAAAQLLGIGFSFTLHGSDLLQRGDLLSTKLHACRFCITISEFNRQHILRKYPSVPVDKVMVNRLGVDQILAWPTTNTGVCKEQRRFCLLSVGRLHRVKDHPFLIQACAALRDRGVDFLCWIVGEGPERKSLERRIEAAGLQGRVYLIGHVSHADLPGYYHYADLVVLTSQSEGIPVVLMEAMARQKIVLAPAITGIPELVEHQHTGFLYQAGSLPDFVSAVCWIQSHQLSMAGIGRAAAASISASYNRQRNLRAFAEQFLARIPQLDNDHENSVLQQVRLSV